MARMGTGGRNAAKPLPSLQRVSEILRLDDRSESGLAWRKDVAPRARAGQRAGSVQPTTGHWRIKIDGEAYGAHRIVYLLAKGIDPGERVVDHIDGDGLNNDPKNLRLATWDENARNRRSVRGSASEFLGVGRERATGKWVAQISVDGKRKRLGTSEHEDVAALMYDEAAVAAWGEFANTNFPRG